MSKLYDLLELIITKVNTATSGLANCQPKGDYAKTTDIPTKLSQLINDAGYLTNGKIAELKGAVIAATGDSTVAATTGQSTLGGYVKLIADMFDMEYENVAVGGATVASGISNDNGNVRFSICDSIATMRTDADIILLSGGVNDQAMMNHDHELLGELTADFSSKIDKTTLYGGLEYMLRQAVYKWSNKTILYVIPHRMTKNLAYRTAIIATCGKYGVPVVDIFASTPDFYFLTEFPERYTANADGWHPNEDGYRVFYVPQIISAVLKNFKGRGDTISLTDSNLESLVAPVPETYTPNIAGFIRDINGTISTSANYLRTDYIPLGDKTEAEYDSFVVSASNMATWAIFDDGKKWLASSGDVNGNAYYTTSGIGSTLVFGHMKNKISIDELRKQYSNAAYIVLSTCVNPEYKTVMNQNGEDVGWGSVAQYITLR